MKRNFKPFAVIPSLLLLAACGSATNPAASANSVIVGSAASAEVLPLDVGLQKGIYSAKGVDLIKISAVGIAPALAALESDSANVVLQSPVLAATSAQRGGDAKMFCGLISRNWLSVYANPGAGVQPASGPGGWKAAVESWKGKSVGVAALGSSLQAAVENVLKAAGIDTGSVRFVSVGQGAQAVAALTSGSVDLLVSFPFQSQLISPADAELALDFSNDLPADLGNQQLAAVMARKSWLDSHADLAKAFCDGIGESIAVAKDPANADTAKSVLSSEFGLTGNDQLTSALSARGPLSYLSSEINCAGVEAILKNAKSRGDLQPTTSTSCDDYTWKHG